MSDTQNFANMGLDLLAEHCANETKKYFRGVAHETIYCFELLCRACRDGMDTALTYVYNIYLPMLVTRARWHPQFPQSSQDADAIAHTALSRFYFAVKGEKFLQKFSTLAQTIAYMYTCVHTAILEDVRNNPPSEISIEDDISTTTQPTSIELQELWNHICGLLPDEDARRLAYLRFALEMKPAEISARYPQMWDSPRRVSVALQDIRRRLRTDSYLRGMAGLSDEAEHRTQVEMTDDRESDKGK